MPHKVVRRRIFILTALLAAATPIVLASAFAVVAYAPVFGDFRRNLAVRVLSDFLELPIAIDGDVDVVVARSLKLRISEVRIAGRNRPEGHRARPMNLVELSFPLWPALAGSFEVSELVISGGRLELTGETGSGMSAAGIARLPSGFLNTRVSDHLEFRDFAIHYQDTSGWEFEWTIDMFSSQRSASGERIVLDSQGTLNGLPYSLSGSFANPRADKGDRGREPFELIVDFSGLAAKVGGTLEVFNPVAVLDAQIEVAADSLATLLELLRLEYQTRGKFTLGAKLTGRLDSIRAERIALGFTDAWGRTFELTGGIADLGVGEGIDVVFSAALTGDGQRRGKSAPISEIDVTGFEGKFTGSLDRLVVNQFFLFTNVAAAELNHIGPIDLGQVVRDLDGKLGLLGIRILKGPEDDRIFDFSGEITDVLDLSGIRLAGDFNVSLAGVLMLEPGPRASDLGRLKGVLTLSDAGGSLQLEEFQAAIHGTKLIAFSVRKAESQEGAADSLTLVIDLDIPDFGAVAARLEGKARSGPVGFAGDLAFEERRTVLRGEVKIGRTETTVEGRLGFKDDAPFVWADLASDLLYMTDIERSAEVYNVFAAMSNATIDIELTEGLVKQTRAEFDLRVAELDANGNNVGNIRAEGHYLNGVAVLEPVHMSYLNGTVDARVQANTNRSPTPVAIKGEIDKLDMGSLLASLEIRPLLTGALDSTFDLSVLIDDRTAISRSLNGNFEASIWGGVLNSRAIDLGGQNIVRWMFSGKGEAKLVCAVAALDFTDGDGRAKSIVIETDNVQVVGAGNIDLAAGFISLNFSTLPKRRELIDVATPFSVSGTLMEPVVRIAPGVKAGRVAQEALTLPLNLLGLLLPRGQSEEKHRPCVVEEVP